MVISIGLQHDYTLPLWAEFPRVYISSCVTLRQLLMSSEICQLLEAVRLSGHQDAGDFSTIHQLELTLMVSKAERATRDISN